MNEKGGDAFEHWGEAEKEAMIKSGIEGGAELDKLPIGSGLEIATRNTVYLVEHRSDGFYLSGNEAYCQQPTKVEGLGSNFTGRSGSMFKPEYIGRGMFMEFITPAGKQIVTSEIKEIREVSLSEKTEETNS